MSKSHPRWRLAKKILTAVFYRGDCVVGGLRQKSGLGRGLEGHPRLQSRCTAQCGRAGGRQLSDLRLLRPARPFLLRSQTGEAPVMLVSFICYAFNLTLSTGSAALVCAIVCTPTGVTGQHYYADFFAQYYHQLARLYFASGVIFTAGVVELPDHWYVDQTTLRILGIGLLMIIAVYLWFCAFAKHRHMTIKGQKLVLPSWKFALAQMLISSVNWMVMGAIIWLLLGQSVSYFFVLGVLLVSSIAGVIVHIPAGIGVLEAVFIALLAGEHTSKGTIIAALLAYRVLYYFIPLLLALICYLLLESQAKKLRAKNEAAM